MQIWHEFQYGRKNKVISTLSGLKKYCTINNISLPTFLKEKHDFSFEIMNEEIERCDCRLCGSELKIVRNGIDTETKTIHFVLCSCAEAKPLQVTEKRFHSVFSNDLAEKKYKDYCQRKTKNWQPKNPDASSLSYHTKKYGESEGKIIYKQKNKKCDTVSKNYFVKQGYSEQEAVSKQKERQTTFSLEKCIAKYGEEVGRTVFNERQHKWQKTLQSKSDEELERINQAKVWKSKGHSRISQVLFENIGLFGARYGEKTKINLGEKVIRLSNGKMAMVDYYFAGKIIEFFGDYWHANPLKYHKDTIFSKYSSRGINKTANEIWQEDANRIALIEEQGYEVMIVWENDFRTNPDKTIEMCREFLCNI